MDIGNCESSSRYIGSPAWPWFTAGTLVGALFVVLMIVSRVVAS